MNQSCGNHQQENDNSHPRKFKLVSLHTNILAFFNKIYLSTSNKWGAAGESIPPGHLYFQSVSGYDIGGFGTG